MKEAFFDHNRKLNITKRVWLNLIPLSGQLPQLVARAQYMRLLPGHIQMQHRPKNTHHYLHRAHSLDEPV